MSAPVLYTERVAVRMSAELRSAIEDRLGDEPLATAMRHAALRSIRRKDLIHESWQPDRRRPKRRRWKSGWVVIPVSMTAGQRRALHAASVKREQALSALLVDSLLFELKLGPRESLARADHKDSLPARVRKIVASLYPSLKLPVAKATSVPLEIRQKIAVASGVVRPTNAATRAKWDERMDQIRGILEADPSRVGGYPLGKRRSAPPDQR